ncbi:ROK family transcriptional regulator [Microbacterium sp.]|uniref:ROK family transcriptional regulator n=1 Tax=Microbacterium sp. TaxID=51671 RepID=UPI003F9883C5
MTQIDAGTSTWLRARNDRAALRLLLQHGQLTRTQLGELSGMSKPTAGQMLTRLERAELVHRVGHVSGSRGPTAVSYGVRADRLTGVAVSMHAETIQAVVVDALDTEHPTVDIPVTGVDRSPEQDIRAAIEAASRAAQIDAKTVAVAAVGVQAAVWRDRDGLSLTDTLPGWPAEGARARIEAALHVDVTLENDVNLATMAERASGVAQHASSFALLWLGDGIGVGVDLEGVIHRGASGRAGEIGYLPLVEADGPAGRTDTTDLLGGPAVVALLEGEGPARYADRVSDLAADPSAIGILADRVALALDPVLAILDPAMVVLGGPTCRAAGESLSALVASRLSAAAHPELEVQLSDIEVSPVLLGARQVLIEQIRTRLEARIPVD